MAFRYKYLGSCEVDYNDDDLENIALMCKISHDYYWPQERFYEKFVDGDRVYKYSFQEAECEVLPDDESFDGNDHLHVEMDDTKIGTIPFKKTEKVQEWLNQGAFATLHISGGPYKEIKETPDGLLAYEIDKNDFSVRVSFSIKEYVLDEVKEEIIEPVQKSSAKNYTITLLCGIFLGFLGIHRFYAGKIGTGVLYLLTFGVFGIGWLIDVVWLLGNCFEDYAGAPIVSEKGKARINAYGLGAQHNVVPEVCCWVFIAAAVALAAYHFYMGYAEPEMFMGGLHWYALLVGLVCYPCVIAWKISDKGVD